MSDAALRPLSGLELARAVLLGLSAGLAGAPLLAAIDLPAPPEGLAPLAPAWIARGGSLALGVGLACLAVPRLLGRGPLERNRLRAEVAIQLATLASLAGTIATMLVFAVLLTPPAPQISVSPLLGVMVSPVGGTLAAGATCGALSGRNGRWFAARKGALVGLGAWALGLWTLLLGGVLCLGCFGRAVAGGPLERALPVIVGCAALALPLFLLPSMVRAGDAFDEPSLP